MKITWFRWIAWIGVVGAACEVRAVTQQPAPVAIAPVSALLQSAKKVFLSNAGADSGLFPHPFSGDPDRAYNEFYANIESWGRCQLVATPAEADLVFEIQLTAPMGPPMRTSRRERRTRCRCFDW